MKSIDQGKFLSHLYRVSLNEREIRLKQSQRLDVYASPVSLYLLFQHIYLCITSILFTVPSLVYNIDLGRLYHSSLFVFCVNT
jgi:uncharacterized membrane protein YdfJ with MMPL/SSD domain